MPNWKKVIVSGSDASLNSLNVATSFTASGLTYPSSDNGEFSFIQTDGNGNLSLQYVNTIYEVIHNGETTQIAKGTPLYVSGSQGAESIVYRADAGNPAKMPVTYIAADNIDPGTTGRGIVLGLITGVNTTGYSAGTEIYVAVGGGWTSTRPTGSAIVQLLGIVTKEGTGGQGLVLNPGPFNKPNLNPGDVWVGDNNWIGQPVPTSSLSVNFALTSSYTTGPIATATVPGIVELFSNTVQATAANAVTTTASRTYGIQLNSSGQMVVNVPWTDTVYTHPSYTARSITATGAQVLSTFTSDTLGHVTGITTRALTPADIGAQAVLTNPVTGTGVSGQVTFWNGTNTITGDTGFIWDNTNKRLGIGATPLSTFYISRLSGTPDIADPDNNAISVRRSDSPVVFGMGWTSANVFYLQGKHATNLISSFPIALNPNGDNVLIGTLTNSGDKLRVNGTVRIDSVTNATGDFVRIDANNVLRRRTAAETLTDIGAQADLDIISLAELNTGTATTERSVNSKNLNDWLSGKLSGGSGYNEESLTYTSSNVFTLAQSNPTALNVYIHGQRKRPGLDYTVSGNQITFLDTLQPSFDIKVTYFYSVPGVTLSGTGTANYITKWSGTTGLANSILYDTGTNVGVNEANPQARVDIGGTLRVQSVPNGIGDFITTDVSGSITRRTAAQALVDLGAVAPIYKHTQGSASTSWVITHNLNFTNPLVTIYNNENKVIIPEEIISTSNNVVTVLLTEATSGYATIAGGSLAVISETQAIVNSLIFG